VRPAGTTATPLLREWADQGGIDMSWLYGDQPELPHVRSVPSQ
jgi:hypothetical protein